MKCGMGNWADISDQYVKQKSATLCEEHYFSVIYQASQQPNNSDNPNAQAKPPQMKYDTLLAGSRQDFKEVIKPAIGSKENE